MRNLEFEKNSCDTPLIKISDKLYAKLETFNPTGSIKDRTVSYIFKKAIERNLITENSVVCEATSGNTGISLSAIAASSGLKCIIFMPSNMSEERKEMMKIYGAEIIEAPPNDFISAIKMRDEFLSNNPEAWSPMQFSNPDNIECHREITATEISMRLWLMNKKWCAFVHGAGTGGTIEGIRQYINAQKGFLHHINSENEKTKVCMVVPEESPHGIQGIADGKDFLAKKEDMDQIITVSTEDALKRAKLFSKETGFLVGISSGANLVASERWIQENNPEGLVVTMLCDRGERYMSLFTEKKKKSRKIKKNK